MISFTRAKSVPIRSDSAETDTDPPPTDLYAPTATPASTTHAGAFDHQTHARSAQERTQIELTQLHPTTMAAGIPVPSAQTIQPPSEVGIRERHPAHLQTHLGHWNPVEGTLQDSQHPMLGPEGNRPPVRMYSSFQSLASAPSGASGATGREHPLRVPAAGTYSEQDARRQSSLEPSPTAGVGLSGGLYSAGLGLDGSHMDVPLVGYMGGGLGPGRGSVIAGRASNLFSGVCASSCCACLHTLYMLDPCAFFVRYFRYPGCLIPYYPLCSLTHVSLSFSP